MFAVGRRGAEWRRAIPLRCAGRARDIVNDRLEKKMPLALSLARAAKGEDSDPHAPEKVRHAEEVRQILGVSCATGRRTFCEKDGFGSDEVNSGSSQPARTIVWMRESGSSAAGDPQKRKTLNR